MTAQRGEVRSRLLLRKLTLCETPTRVASGLALPTKKRHKQFARMIAAPEMRRFICTTAQPDRSATQVQQRINYVNSKPPPESARKRVLGVFFSRFTVCFGCLFLCEVHLPAQVWNGTTGVNWTTGANWAGGLAPVSTGTATFNAPTPFSPTINTAVATGSLLFTGTASQNFSGGNTLTLNGVGGVGINNQVNYAPTFANPITLGASQTWQAANAAGGGMTFNGTINLGANTLILGPQNVANSIRINSVIAGTGALNKTGVGSVVLTGANTFSGGTTVTAARSRLAARPLLEASAEISRTLALWFSTGRTRIPTRD